MTSIEQVLWPDQAEFPAMIDAALPKLLSGVHTGCSGSEEWTTTLEESFSQQHTQVNTISEPFIRFKNKVLARTSLSPGSRIHCSSPLSPHWCTHQTLSPPHKTSVGSSSCSVNHQTVSSRTSSATSSCIASRCVPRSLAALRLASS